jgi:Fur family transcriptional regulator, ferric uptake regulator
VTPVNRRATEELRWASWQAFCRAEGLKQSRSRDTIVRAFLGSERHLNVREILALVRRRSQRIGMSTVHRTMKLLEQAGLAQRHDFYGGAGCYETRREDRHDHMICTACGEIFEFESEEIERMQDHVARQRGFHVHKHRHELYGTCAGCQAPVPGQVVR